VVVVSGVSVVAGASVVSGVSVVSGPSVVSGASVVAGAPGVDVGTTDDEVATDVGVVDVVGDPAGGRVTASPRIAMRDSVGAAPGTPAIVPESAVTAEGGLWLIGGAGYVDVPSASTVDGPLVLRLSRGAHSHADGEADGGGSGDPDGGQHDHLDGAPGSRLGGAIE
jgi:hypothetical protein